MSLITTALARAGGAPVQPDAPTGRAWLRDELAKAQYVRAQPTAFDRFAEQIQKWLTSLTAPSVQGGPPVGLLLIAAAVAVLVIIVIAIYGVPRLNRRSRVPAMLFGEDDDRDAATIRRAARAAAATGDWVTAIAEQFRAIARSLDDRTVVNIRPGTTAHEVARRAGTAFPNHAGELEWGASAFDAVRYLDGIGSEADWRRLVALDEALQNSRPVFDADAVLAAGAPR